MFTPPLFAKRQRHFLTDRFPDSLPFGTTPRDSIITKNTQATALQLLTGFDFSGFRSCSVRLSLGKRESSHVRDRRSDEIASGLSSSFIGCLFMHISNVISIECLFYFQERVCVKEKRKTAFRSRLYNLESGQMLEVSLCFGPQPKLDIDSQR